MAVFRRRFIFVHQESIDRLQPNRFGRSVPGLLTTRSATGISTGFVGLRKLSCVCKACLEEKFLECANTKYVDNWKMMHVRTEAEPCCNARTPCTPGSDGTLTRTSTAANSLPTSSTNAGISTLCPTPIISLFTGISPLLDEDDIDEGMYVLVKITNDSGLYSQLFIAEVTDVSLPDITVHFLKLSTKTSNVFHKSESDSSIINFEDIVGYPTDPPIVQRRGLLKFQVDTSEWICK